MFVFELHGSLHEKLAKELKSLDYISNLNDISVQYTLHIDLDKCKKLHQFSRLGQF